MSEIKSDTEQVVMPPKLTGKSFRELPIEEQKVLETIAEGLSKNAELLGIDFEESLLAELGRTEEERKEYQAALKSLVKKGWVIKTESDGPTSYDLAKEDRDFLESKLRELKITLKPSKKQTPPLLPIR